MALHRSPVRSPSRGSPGRSPLYRRPPHQDAVERNVNEKRTRTRPNSRRRNLSSSSSSPNLAPQIPVHRRDPHEVEGDSEKLRFSLYISTGDGSSHTLCIQGEGDLTFGSRKTHARRSLDGSKLNPRQILSVITELSKVGLSVTAHFDDVSLVNSPQLSIETVPTKDERLAANRNSNPMVTPLLVEDDKALKPTRHSIVVTPSSGTPRSLTSSLSSSLTSSLSSSSATPRSNRQSPVSETSDISNPRSPLSPHPRSRKGRITHTRSRGSLGLVRPRSPKNHPINKHMRGRSSDAVADMAAQLEGEVYTFEFECQRVLLANIDLDSGHNGIGARVVNVKKDYPVKIGSMIMEIDGEDVQDRKFRSIKSKLSQSALSSRPVVITFIHDELAEWSRGDEWSNEQNDIVRVGSAPPQSPNIRSQESPTNRRGTRRKANRGGSQPRVKSAEPDRRGSSSQASDYDEAMRRRIDQDVVETSSGTSFADIHGLMDVKLALYWVFRLFESLDNGFMPRSKLLQPPNGILLFGPPGNGKTMIAKCLAHHFPSWTFFSISASSILSKWVGEAERCMRTLFTMAEERAPSIIFIDEIDCLLTSRKEGEHDQSRRIKTEFLSRFNSDNNEGIVVIGSTNVPQQLDEAVLRRFKCRILVSLPDFDGRYGYLRTVMETEDHAMDEEDFNLVADMTDGFSYCDLEQLCSSAALAAYAEATQHSVFVRICMSHFSSSFETTHPSVNAETVQKCKKWNDDHASSVPRSALQNITLPEDWLPIYY